MDDYYRISFFSEPGHWHMILSDKNRADSLVRITVSGASGQPADKIEIHQADGDRSVYRLEKDGEGKSIQAAILQLEAKIVGR